MLNVQLSYKPTSSWRILFWSWRRPRQFSCLKKFKALVVPSGGCRKGIFLQCRYLTSYLSIIGQSYLRRKMDVTGASVHATRQRNSTYAPITDDQNTPTRQSDDTNDAPRDPLHVPVTKGGRIICRSGGIG